MDIRRVLTLAAAVAAFVTAPALLVAQDAEKIEQREQRDIQALVQMVNDAAAGTQPAPADFGLQWEGEHFMKTAGGGTYIPFTVAIDAAQLAGPDIALYVRAVSKAATASAEPATEFPWDDVNVVNLGPDGKVSRAMALAPGEYDVFIAIKEQGPLDVQDRLGNRVDTTTKAAVLRRDLTVPDFNGSDLAMSSVLVGTIEPLAAPLDAEAQKENPYTFGQMSVTVAPSCAAAALRAKAPRSKASPSWVKKSRSAVSRW